LLHLPQLFKGVFAPFAKTNEILGAQLNTIHNIHYYINLMSEIRQSLDEDLFPEFIKEFHKNRALGVLETTG